MCSDFYLNNNKCKLRKYQALIELYHQVCFYCAVRSSTKRQNVFIFIFYVVFTYACMYVCMYIH